MPTALLADPAHAVDPTQTQITLPDQMLWKPWSAGGAVGAMESAAVFGETFEPENTVPVPSGGFVRHVAHTPHYDGVKRGGKEPAVIGIFGQAPIELKLVDPSKPPFGSSSETAVISPTASRS